MAIISENNRPARRRYRNTQLRYSILYIIVTFFVLLFLNIYCSGTSQQLFYKGKEASMIEKCQLTASEIAKLDLLSPTTAAEVVAQMESLTVTRLIITDHRGVAVYDSQEGNSAVGKFCLLPEIVDSLNMYKSFSWDYHDGTMSSRAAAPIVSYGTLIGCVYMMEFDVEQGALIKTLQQNILYITFVLEIVVILVSIIFSGAFSRRFRRILHSMRIIRGGDYSHKVVMTGNDELAFLGNEFNILTDRLQTSESKRRQFVSDASHELKTPLASIKLLSDTILQNDVDMDTVREFVGDIGNEADRLNRMSQKLLSLTRVESQQDGECEIIAMAPTVERVVRMLSGIAENSGITIELKLDDPCPILVLEDDLYQIIFNLVENGIKYNVSGGKLTISLSQKGEDAILQVQDTGVGIPEESLDHIFDRFYRVDKARSRKSGGSGLGLSIVRNMVSRNHGSIHVESTPGKGSTFTAIFPIFDTEEDAT